MISYQVTLENISTGKLNGFFEGWKNPPSHEKHLELLRNSSYVVLALDDDTGNVIGFINAISDKVLCAYIPLLEVLSAYRNRGIGKELVNRMLALVDEYYMIDLTCDSDMSSFYEQTGFAPSSGMMKRNYDRQSGIK